MNAIHMKVGDTSPLPVFTLYDANGIADLSSGDSARFIMQSSDGDYVTAEDATFVAGSSTAGQVTLSEWTTDANGSSGQFQAEIEVTWQDATRTTFPTETFIPIIFHGEATTSS